MLGTLLNNNFQMKEELDKSVNNRIQISKIPKLNSNFDVKKSGIWAKAQLREREDFRKVY